MKIKFSMEAFFFVKKSQKSYVPPVVSGHPAYTIAAFPKICRMWWIPDYMASCAANHFFLLDQVCFIFLLHKKDC